MTRKTQFLRYHQASIIKRPQKIIPVDKWPDEWKRIYFKGYPRFERISLSKKAWKKLESVSLLKAIKKRKTRREPQKTKIDKAVVSAILLSGAITRVKKDVLYSSFRAYPSGGARYPNEIYVATLRVGSLKKGVYHYHVRTHSLEYLWNFPSGVIEKIFPQQNFLNESKAIVFITSLIERSFVKYGERSYRYALIEAGHIVQNIYLIGEALGVGICALGGFRDEEVGKLLDIDIEEELPLYAVAVL